MKKEFIRIISPISAAVSFILDSASVWLTVFTVKDFISGKADGLSVAFAFMVVFAIIISILFTKEAFSNGIIFYDDKCEFNAIDENNIIYYKDIEHIEDYRDTKASLRKNFIQRHSLIIFHLKNDTVLTVDIGISTGKTLKKINSKLHEYIKKNG